MKLCNIVAATALPTISVLATPLQVVRDASAEAIVEKGGIITASYNPIRDAAAEHFGLVRRDATCDIKHVSTTVDCWWLPIHHHEDDGNFLVKSIPGTTKNIDFICYARCENVKGITAWYFTNKYAITILGSTIRGCYVPGYYTDDNCRSTGSTALPHCTWAHADEIQVGC